MFVLDVSPEGAAGKDGRLQPGDQILSIGNESFMEIEHDKARETVLKQAAGTVCGICTLLNNRLPFDEMRRRHGTVAI